MKPQLINLHCQLGFYFILHSEDQYVESGGKILSAALLLDGLVAQSLNARPTLVGPQVVCALLTN